MHISSIVCLAGIFAALAPQAAAQSAGGPFGVGVATRDVVDPTRSAPDSPHAVKVWLWFPVDDTGLPPATVGSFFSESPEQLDWLYDEPVSFGADSAALSSLLEFETRSAWIGPRAAEGVGQLIVIGQGVGQPAFANFGTNELLASHGFLVASTASGWSPNGRSDLDNQLSDFEVAVRTAREIFPHLALDSVAFLAHSAGAQAAALATVRGWDVAALALLDPSVLGVREAAALRSEAGWGSGIGVPTLLAMSHWWRLGAEPHPNLDTDIIDGFVGSRVTLDMRFMEHPDFVSLDHLRSETVDYAAAGLTYDFERAERGLTIVQEMLVHFFRWSLLGDAEALKLLSQGVDGVESEGEYSLRR